MGAPLRRGNIIDKTVASFIKFRIVLEGYLHKHITLLPLTVYNILIERILIFVQILHIFFNTALVVIGLCPHLILPEIREDDLHPFGEKSHFPQTFLQYLKFIYGCLSKNGLIRKKGNLRSTAIRRTNLLQGIHGMSFFITLLISLSILTDLYLQPVGKGIDYRSTYTVQTAGHLISPAAKFSSCVQNGKNHLYCRLARLMIETHRNSPPIICHSDGIIRIDINLDLITISGKRLVNAVIDDLIYQMMKPSLRCASYIHSRSFADSRQSLKDLYLICSIYYFIFLFHLETSVSSYYSCLLLF